MFLPFSYCSDKSSRNKAQKLVAVACWEDTVKLNNWIFLQYGMKFPFLIALSQSCITGPWCSCELPELPLVRDLTRGTTPSKGMKDTYGFDGNACVGLHLCRTQEWLSWRFVLMLLLGHLNLDRISWGCQWVFFCFVVLRLFGNLQKPFCEEIFIVITILFKFVGSNFLSYTLS